MILNGNAFARTTGFALLFGLLSACASCPSLPPPVPAVLMQPARTDFLDRMLQTWSNVSNAPVRNPSTLPPKPTATPDN